MAETEADKIMLDSSSFKALASETRVLILKELDKKRSTASEIAKILGISVQAASEHLENLRVAGLVERVDEGRKWIYFQLTEKGQAVLHPNGKKRLWVLLSLFFLVLASAGFMLFNQPSQPLASEQVSAPFLEQDQLKITGNDAFIAQVSEAQGNPGWSSAQPSLKEEQQTLALPANATNSTA